MPHVIKNVITKLLWILQIYASIHTVAGVNVVGMELIFSV